MNAFIVISIVFAAIVGGMFLVGMTAQSSPPIGPIGAVANLLKGDPDKLGWLDDAVLSEGDYARAAALSGSGYGDNLGVIRSIQAGSRGNVTRRDFELLRQDRRRASAAYPDVNSDELFSGTWLNVSLSARVPDSFCTSHNSNGTQGSDGKWYLDGGCYVSIVKPQYTERANAADTKRHFAELKARQLAERTERLRADGPFSMWGGTGGSMSVRLDKQTRMVVITRAQEWAATAKRWTMPFVPEEWTDTNAGDLEAIKKLPSFAQATEEDIKVSPSGTSIVSSGQGGVLMPGESMTVGVQIPHIQQHH